MAKKNSPTVSRQNLEDVHKITSRCEADEALAIIAEAQREIDRVNLELNEEIDALKEQAKAATADAEALVKIHEARLKAFATANRESVFQGQRSIQLNYGRIGFRKSSSLALAAKGDTWEELLLRLKGDGGPEALSAIRLKEEPNKDILLGWGEDRLTQFGLVLKETEKFWLEVAKEEVEG
jgi:phage host-nuclease inhibitor protein Gam